MNPFDLKKGYSLHVGINRLAADARVYANIHVDDSLRACENDAKAYASLAVESGFTKINVLLSEFATKQNFLKIMQEYQRDMRNGDLLFLSFAGHGGQIPDTSGDELHDLMDEVWCFHDDILIDDELLELWKKFDPGVRILVISDSCHSGDILMGGQAARANNRRMFTDMSHQLVKASVQIMAACRENQITRERHCGGKWHGSFTLGLMNSILAKRDQTYPELFQNVQSHSTRSQIPHREFLGTSSETFFDGVAFQI